MLKILRLQSYTFIKLNRYLFTLITLYLSVSINILYSPLNLFADRDAMAQILGRMNRVLMLLSRPIIFSGSTPIPSFSRFLSILSQNPIFVNQTPLLQTVTPTIQQSCGMKVKGRLRRRCKDCYFVWREESKWMSILCSLYYIHFL